MSQPLSVAANLSPTVRQDIGIQVLSRSFPISQLADKHQVSRKFVYQQGDKAQQALDESFAPSQGDDDVLFHLPVTRNWLFQLIWLCCKKCVAFPWYSKMPCSQTRYILLKPVQMASLPIRHYLAECTLVSALWPELPGLRRNDARTGRRR